MSEDNSADLNELAKELSKLCMINGLDEIATRVSDSGFTFHFTVTKDD